jgi:hypothetical protein
MTKFFLTTFVLTAGLMTAEAQFHATDKKSGATTVNKQAVQSAQQQAQSIMSSQGGSAQLGENAHSTIYVSEAHKRNYGARMGQQDSKVITAWGRSIHHSDESYTESVQDETTNTLEQVTKSKNGTKLHRRMVMLDDLGRPSEIMIYDGRDQFKYRGVQLYDEIGRFREEHLFDAKGTLIRRKVQEYDLQGKKLPLRSWDYVASVPKDLQLVITRESEKPGVNSGSKVKPKEKRGLFGSGQIRNQNQQRQPGAPATAGVGSTTAGAGATETTAPAKRKGLNLGRLFSGKKSAE